MNVGQPKGSWVDRLIAIVLHNLLLDGLHHISQEPLGLFNETVVPHLGSNKIDKVRWEQHFFVRWRVVS